MNIYLDLDGPILDVSNRYYSVHQTIAERYQFNPLDKQQYWDLKRSHTPINQILKYCSVDISSEDYSKHWLRLIERRDFLEHDKLFPETKDILGALGKNSRLILVTLRKNIENLIWELEHLAIKDLFHYILVKSNNAGTSMIKQELVKSDPLFSPKSSLIVGDTEIDILAGKTLNIRTIACTQGIRSKDFLLNLHPDFLIDSLSELNYIVDFLNSEVKAR